MKISVKPGPEDGIISFSISFPSVKERKNVYWAILTAMTLEIDNKKLPYPMFLISLAPRSIKLATLQRSIEKVKIEEVLRSLRSILHEDPHTRSFSIEVGTEGAWPVKVTG